MKSTSFYFKALLLLLVLGHFSCKHEPPAEPPTPCTYDCSLEEMKNYYFFKTGTWWVYEEENTLQVDTFTVYDHYETEYGSFGYSLRTTFENGYLNYDHLEGRNYPCYSNPECTGRRVQLARYNWSLGGVIERELFNYPHIQGNFLNVLCIIGAGNYVNGNSTLVETNVAVINDWVIFPSTVKYRVEADALYGGDTTNYFFSRNVGLVRFENNSNNETWNLVEYHVVQ